MLEIMVAILSKGMLYQSPCRHQLNPSSITSSLTLYFRGSDPMEPRLAQLELVATGFRETRRQVCLFACCFLAKKAFTTTERVSISSPGLRSWKPAARMRIRKDQPKQLLNVPFKLRKMLFNYHAHRRPQGFHKVLGRAK